MDGILEQILVELKQLNQSLQALPKIDMPDKTPILSEDRQHTLTLKEAAAYANLTYNHIRLLAIRKEIKHIRVGARYLFRKTAIDEWLTDTETRSIMKDDAPVRKIKKGIY